MNLISMTYAWLAVEMSGYNWEIIGVKLLKSCDVDKLIMLMEWAKYFC
ncbi:MAG: hypothetical protein GQ475_06095 [Methylococcaceae bacterium]|nr:hypothetical protein [Methylococcaceae bacterium]